MRNLMSRSARALLTLTIVLTAACASGASTPGTGDAAAADTPTGGITIRVENDHRSGYDMQIYLVPEAGQRQLIGTVTSGAIMNHTFTGTRGGMFRLLAERLPETVESGSFRPTSGVYTWRMSGSRVVQTGR